MPLSEPEALYLRRVDPACNMARFYVLAIQPTLFGGASLLRNWGRIGTKGRAMMETFDGDLRAGEAFARRERCKRSRGYLGVLESSPKP